MLAQWLSFQEQDKSPVLRWRVLFIVTVTLTICSCVEEEQPEVFLSPRNFNPHPYQAGYEAGSKSTGNRGPVLFPETPPDSNLVNVDAGNVNTLTNNIHPVDVHPYATVAKKQRYKQAGRWQIQDNHVNPEVYNALAAHAEKVLNKPAPEIHAEYRSPAQDIKKNYAFSYKVVDHLTGDDFSHTQSQDAQATNGEYRVKLPDGRVQIVSYTADKNGYKADVKYTENESGNLKGANPQYTIQNVNNDIKIPFIIKSDQYDYVYDDDLTRPNSNYIQADVRPYENRQIGQLPLYPVREVYPAQPQADEYIAVTPPTPQPPIYHYSPASAFLSHKQNAQHLIYTNKFQVIPEQKLQLFAAAGTNEQQKVGKFISPTLAPYTLVGSSKGFQQNVVSTPSPDLDRYSPVYINKPKFVESHSQQHQLFYRK